MKAKNVWKTLFVALLTVTALSACQQPECDKKGKQCKVESEYSGKACHKGKHHGKFIGNIKHALKSLPLAKEEWGDVRLAIASYKKSKHDIKRGTPLKALEGGKFNKELFIASHPLNKKILAKAELLETIYLILNDDQKKRFPMLLGANTYFGGQMCVNKGDGKVCPVDGKTCDKKGQAGKNCKGKKCD